jgi:hypothetical protein
MFKTSESTVKIDEAIAKVQSELEPAKQSSINDHFGSPYANFADVWAAVQRTLPKHGLNITQWPLDAPDNRLRILTRIAGHGEWMSTEFSVPCERQTPQGYKSALTYCRRMTLEAILCVPTEDDDGNMSSKPPAQKKSTAVSISPPAKATTPANGCISEAQQRRLFTIATHNNWTKEEVAGLILNVAKVTSSKDIPWQKYEEICKYIEQNPMTGEE